jgi:hypothetical protein
MSTHPFRTALEAKDLDGVAATLAEEAVLHSPVFFRGVEGRESVVQALLLVAQVIDDVEFINEIRDRSTVLLRFTARVGELDLEGVDLLTLDEDGKIVDLTVFMRPYSAATAFREGMLERVASLESG